MLQTWSRGRSQVLRGPEWANDIGKRKALFSRENAENSSLKKGDFVNRKGMLPFSSPERLR